jgi:hypothetical protein
MHIYVHIYICIDGHPAATKGLLHQLASCQSGICLGLDSRLLQANEVPQRPLSTTTESQAGLTGCQ